LPAEAGTMAERGPAQKDGDEGGEGEEEKMERGLSEPLSKVVEDIAGRSSVRRVEVDG